MVDRFFAAIVPKNMDRYKATLLTRVPFPLKFVKHTDYNGKRKRRSRRKITGSSISPEPDFKLVEAGES